MCGVYNMELRGGYQIHKSKTLKICYPPPSLAEVIVQAKKCKFFLWAVCHIILLLSL